MELCARQKDGATLREHLQAAAATTGQADPALLVPPVPRECRAVWSAYASMSSSRRSGMSAHALTLTDIEAWCRLHDVRLSSWELDTITALDAASLRIASKNQGH